jgi:hypothetical protein
MPAFQGSTRGLVQSERMARENWAQLDADSSKAIEEANARAETTLKAAR